MHSKIYVFLSGHCILSDIHMLQIIEVLAAMRMKESIAIPFNKAEKRASVNSG